MKIYLDGAEFKTYREIMESIGVKYVCLNYEYILRRTPMFSAFSLGAFEDIMVISGDLSEYELEDYAIFLNRYAHLFSFALSPVELDCDVPILLPLEGNEYYVTQTLMTKPFVPQRIKRSFENGDFIHGVQIDSKYMTTCNMGTWMRGKAGWISHFDDDKQVMRVHQAGYTRSAFARELKLEGWDINLNAVKRNKWQEVAYVNCIAWKKYQDFKESE
jgi:hypothetical protein